jgi:hypothetical protein
MTTQTYGPPQVAALPTPLVVPVDPVRGWRDADAGRRLAALLALPLAAVMALAAATAPVAEWALAAWALAGPATFYSLARVLRPETRSAERTPRHLLAGTATSFAVPVLAATSARYGDDGVIVVLGSPAAVLGVVTVVWGLVALLLRAGRRA